MKCAASPNSIIYIPESSSYNNNNIVTTPVTIVNVHDCNYLSIFPLLIRSRLYTTKSASTSHLQQYTESQLQKAKQLANQHLFKSET
jgi:hypothetical protein